MLGHVGGFAYLRGAKSPSYNLEHITTDKKPLLGLTLEELKGVAAEVGMPAFAAKQMAQWIYLNGLQSWIRLLQVRTKKTISRFRGNWQLILWTALRICNEGTL